MTYLEEIITTACDELFGISTQPQLTRPDEQFGDFACNVALQLAKELKQQPRQVADDIKAYIEANHDGSISRVEVAGPGFLNISLSDTALWLAAQTQPAKLLQDQKILFEYSNPNAFKELHTGHLYQTIAGDSLSRLLVASGATVYRANFGGDVGLHVAKCLWGILEALGGEMPEKLADIHQDEQAQWLGAAYVAGATAYEDDPKAKQEIIKLNSDVYGFHADDNHQTPLAQIYWECRGWSYEYFKRFYQQLNLASFDKYYPESTTIAPGLAIVRENIGPVFVESQGAIVFKGEDYGVHTRVFITSAGLPTYEAKDLGVVMAETADFAYDTRIVMTGNDQSEYMKVVFAALAQLDSNLAAKQEHITNGTVRFGDGKKMSSRLGNVMRAIDVIESVQKIVEADTEQTKQDITLGAIKYAFLKQRLGGDVAFDVNESVSLQGNSGPYLQYAHARARSILVKGTAGTLAGKLDFNEGERSLVRKLGEYSEVVELAVSERALHHICTYLYELAQTFNRFYEHNRVIGDERQDLRLSLVQAYATTLKNGLQLLNIPAPDQM